MSNQLNHLYRHISPRRRRQLVLLLVLMLVGAFAELVSLGAVLPFLTLMSDPSKAADYPLLQDVFEFLGWQKSTNVLLPMTLTFSAIALTTAGLRVLLNWASDKFVFRLGYDLGVRVYWRTLNQPYQFYTTRHSSQIIAAINSVQLISVGVFMPLMQVLIASITSIFILLGLLRIDAQTATIAGTGFATIYLLITMTMRRRLRANSVVIARTQARRIQSVQEGLGGIRNVILDNTQDVYLRKFAAVDGPLRDAQAINNFVSVSPRYLIEAAGMTLIALLAYVLSEQSGGVKAALPVLGALALGAQKLMPLLQQIYHGWTRVAGSWAVIADVVELLEMPIADEHPSEPPSVSLAFRHSIRLEEISFCYQSGAPLVLSNLNLTIPKGVRCGIIGTTGSGKSTLLDLIMGLLEPTGGKLLIDNQAVGVRNRKAWQAHIAHVPQSIYLSDASIAENIAFGVELPHIDGTRVRRAARQAQIADFIESQPLGYETLVGERGVRLSGGQRQRIGIARALYKQADVLVLDEATNALDDATENAVIESIEGLDRELTILIIAHRLSTVSMCDMVIRLDAGAIVAQGTYRDVVVDDPSSSRSELRTGP
jgi:ATP-binding cassette, subfamily B, bacterial PglK